MSSMTLSSHESESACWSVKSESPPERREVEKRNICAHPLVLDASRTRRRRGRRGEGCNWLPAGRCWTTPEARRYSANRPGDNSSAYLQSVLAKCTCNMYLQYELDKNAGQFAQGIVPV